MLAVSLRYLYTLENVPPATNAMRSLVIQRHTFAEIFAESIPSGIITRGIFASTALSHSLLLLLHKPEIITGSIIHAHAIKTGCNSFIFFWMKKKYKCYSDGGNR